MREIHLIRYHTKELGKILKRKNGNIAIIYTHGDTPFAIRQRVKEIYPDIATVIVVITR